MSFQHFVLYRGFMLFPPKELSRVYGVHPQGVLHVGGHLAEEEQDYIREDWHSQEKILWVEANPNLIPSLSERVDSCVSDVLDVFVC
jgi:hypothetical protein